VPLPVDHLRAESRPTDNGRDSGNLGARRPPGPIRLRLSSGTGGGAPQPRRLDIDRQV